MTTDQEQITTNIETGREEAEYVDNMDERVILRRTDDGEWQSAAADGSAAYFTAETALEVAKATGAPTVVIEWARQQECSIITDKQLMAMLERNGYPSAAEAIHAGKSRVEATAYIAGRQPTYEDGEGRWLQQYVDGLHS